MSESNTRNYSSTIVDGVDRAPAHPQRHRVRLVHRRRRRCRALRVVLHRPLVQSEAMKHGLRGRRAAQNVAIPDERRRRRRVAPRECYRRIVQDAVILDGAVAMQPPRSQVVFLRAQQLDSARVRPPRQLPTPLAALESIVVVEEVDDRIVPVESAEPVVDQRVATP